VFRIDLPFVIVIPEIGQRRI